MSSLEILDTPLPGLKVVRRRPHEDTRGFFNRLFCCNELQHAGWQDRVSQVNHTHTADRGTVRGMHFQHPPHAEMKLVTCLAGEIWDVAVDLRRESPTFLQWHAEVLSADNNRAMLIPEGFAHGFQTLTDNVGLLYLHTAFYEKTAEDGVDPLDPMLSIDWPLPVSMLSERDRNFTPLNENYYGVVL